MPSMVPPNSSEPRVSSLSMRPASPVQISDPLSPVILAIGGSESGSWKYRLAARATNITAETANSDRQNTFVDRRSRNGAACAARPESEESLALGSAGSTSLPLLPSRITSANRVSQRTCSTKSLLADASLSSSSARRSVSVSLNSPRRWRSTSSSQSLSLLILNSRRWFPRMSVLVS